MTIDQYQQVLAVLKNPDIFWVKGQEAGNFQREEHARLRASFAKMLQQQGAWMAAAIQSCAEDALSHLPLGEPFDLQVDLVFPFCQNVAFRLVGTEPDPLLVKAAWEVFRMSDEASDGVEGGAAAMLLAQYFMQLLQAKQGTPEAEDCSAALARNADGGLSSLGHLVQLFVGTCTSLPLLLGNAVAALLKYPEQQQRYLEAPENAVSELLRYAGPTQAIYRETSCDTNLDGLLIEKGTRLALCLYKANRDAAVFEQAEKLDVLCPRSGQLSLGHGQHACLGAPLIREALVCFPALLLKSFPALEADFSTELVDGTSAIRGLWRLKVFHNLVSEK